MLAESVRRDTCQIRSRTTLVDVAERNLLARAKAGDLAAFDTLALPHRAAILRLAQRILRNRDDAEDIAQIALLEAYRHLHEFEGRSQFSSWLFSIARNAALMRLRSVKWKREMSLDQMLEATDSPMIFHVVEARPNPEQNCLAQEAWAILNEALARLKPLYRDVFRLRNMQELTEKEVARILSVPVGTVKARLHRAHRRLTQTAQSMVALPLREASRPT